MMSKIAKYITEIMVGFLILYAFLPFLSPILFSNNSQSKIASGIQHIYSNFCHQRPQSSIFLFGGEDSQYFYTLDELKDLDVVPKDSNMSSGAGYWGNEEIGYKVAFCIRDVGIYFALGFFGLLLVLFMNLKKKTIKVHWVFILLFMLPMVFDGIIQIFVMLFAPSWIPDWYLVSMLKKFVTGFLFGVGAALLIFPNLKEASGLGYNEND